MTVSSSNGNGHCVRWYQLMMLLILLGEVLLWLVLCYPNLPCFGNRSVDKTALPKKFKPIGKESASYVFLHKYVFLFVFVFAASGNICIFICICICSFREEREREGREGRERALLFPAASDSTDIDSQQSWWEEVSLNMYIWIQNEIEINF